MIIDLANTEFTNDMFSTMLPDGSTIILNIVNESFTVDGATGECAIKGVNIEILDSEDNLISCPCVIGIGNDIMIIKTDYKEYEGAVLTPDNMMYCTIEIYD